MRRSGVPLLLVATLLLVAACGYRPEGTLPPVAGRPATLFVELAKNRTGRAFIENELTNRIVERFARGGRYRLDEERPTAALVLTPEVAGYTAVASAYSQTDQILLYRATMTLVATLVQGEDGRIVWKGTLTESVEFAASSDRAQQQTNENVAVSGLTVRLADDLYARVAENF